MNNYFIQSTNTTYTQQLPNTSFSRHLGKNQFKSTNSARGEGVRKISMKCTNWKIGTNWTASLMNNDRKS